MYRIAFFSIYAHGHTNPTLPVVRELTCRGHQVRYYSFAPFREKIQAAGAQFVPCDSYLPPAPPDLERRVGRDFAALVEMDHPNPPGHGCPVGRDLAQFRPTAWYPTPCASGESCGPPSWPAPMSAPPPPSPSTAIPPS